MLSFTRSRRGKVASFPHVLSPSLHTQPFVLWHFHLCYLFGSRLVVGFGSHPPNLLPIKGPFVRNLNCRRDSTNLTLNIPFRAFLLTCHCFVSGGQLNSMSLANISSLAVYQSTRVSPPLNTSCLLAAWDHWPLGWTTLLETQT